MTDGTGRDAVATDSTELPADTHVGRVGLRVGSIDRMAAYYEDAIGLAGERDGDRLVLGPTPDEPRLVLESAPDAPPRPRAAAGLFHVAIRVPDRTALGDAVTRLRSAGAPLSGASDHLVSEALYLRDPEGNGLELYRDRPREGWPTTPDGGVGMDTLPLDLADLEAAGTGEHVDALPAGTDVGHVHLEVTDLPRAVRCYRDGLGLVLRARYGAQAAFLAAGGYHHHVGLNTWNGRTGPAGTTRGLAWWELALPDGAARAAVVERLSAAGFGVTDGADVEAIEGGGGVVVTDPDGIRCRLVVPG